MLNLVKKYIIFSQLIALFNFMSYCNYEFKGIYRIDSILNYKYIFINKNSLILSNKYSFFNIIKVGSNSYYFKSRYNNKVLSLDGNNNLKLIQKGKNENISKILWKIIIINNNEYMIQSEFNKKFIAVYNILLLGLKTFKSNTLIEKNFIFNFKKFFEENLSNNFKMVNNEPIDIIIKYIDITDKSLNRTGIHQIYKDEDNEELRYSIRSILLNVPWVRKIFILMPNEKVRFLKSVNEISSKIIYVKDKDLLGYDSANNIAFSFNLYKLEKFGISKNFIYMDDDYFFGKPLKKTDFFYYEEKEKKVFPLIITSKFKEINKTEVLENYDQLYQIKDLIHPHSGKGFTLSILCTEKFYIENYNFSLIRTENTHNAIPENIDDLKKIFELVQKYKYINETLLSKERYILRLSQHHCYNLYQLNIKKNKVHSIPYKYFKMEAINKYNLDVPLFVINTGGNHMPLKRQYKIEKKIMELKYHFHNKYEIYQAVKNNRTIFLYIIHLSIIIIFMKLMIIIFSLDLVQIKILN